MGLLEIFFIGLGLSMDAFAVAVCKGISIKNLKLKQVCIVGLYFGGFQAIMPTVGYFLGSTFENFVNKIDHWIVIILLAFIGGNMIKSAFSDDGDNYNNSIDFKTMLPLAIATSIDALTIGITFAFFKINIFLSALIIGITTFGICTVGVKIGHKFGNKYKDKAQLIGGVILILIGIKILIEQTDLIA